MSGSETVPSTESESQPVAAAPVSKYIVSPGFDLSFFILAPILALLVGGVLPQTPLNNESKYFGDTWISLFLAVFVMSHLIITAFRSHGNPRIFHSFPLRFTIVPVVLFLAMGFSLWAIVIVSVLATFWDVYHSSMQTFGIGRIYDMKAGNEPLAGRRLDITLNILLYAGPIAAGATLMDHINDFSEFERVGSLFFTEIPAYVEFNSGILRVLVLGAGVPFLCYYVYAYWNLSRQGYSVSYQKVALLTFTGICSLFAWGFNPFGMAFFIMNFMHAWQYFAIVWWSDRASIERVFRLRGKPRAGLAALVLLITVGLVYGLIAGLYNGKNDWVFSAFLVVSVMHFWYDGFIWSVKRKQF
ncbi:MAG: hypothetical protein QF512_11840 [Alphaproteobacteria bacterium]|nr:hypothetical protein [Alphaproteobacteria bacterium]